LYRDVVDLSWTKSKNVVFEKERKKIWAHLVHMFKHIFSVFKQHYTYFYTLFYSHVFLKNTNNVTRTTLPNGISLKKKKIKIMVGSCSYIIMRWMRM